VGDKCKIISLIQWGFKSRLNEAKPPADASDFLIEIYRASSIKIRAQIRRANLIIQKGMLKWKIKKLNVVK
jgi:hypothetical protein